jgi:predicted secreted protein
MRGLLAREDSFVAEPNENKIGDGWRERASLVVKA